MLISRGGAAEGIPSTLFMQERWVATVGIREEGEVAAAQSLRLHVRWDLGFVADEHTMRDEWRILCKLPGSKKAEQIFRTLMFLLPRCTAYSSFH